MMEYKLPDIKANFLSPRNKGGFPFDFDNCKITSQDIRHLSTTRKPDRAPMNAFHNMSKDSLGLSVNSGAMRGSEVNLLISG